MLVKWLGMIVACVAIGLVIAVAPGLWGAADKAAPQVSSAEYRQLVRTCENEVAKKVKSMGPFFGSDPDKVRRQCEAAIDARVRVSD